MVLLRELGNFITLFACSASPLYHPSHLKLGLFCPLEKGPIGYQMHPCPCLVGLCLMVSPSTWMCFPHLFPVLFILPQIQLCIAEGRRSPMVSTIFPLQALASLVCTHICLCLSWAAV